MSASGIGGHHGLDVWSYVARLGVHMRGAGDDFFAEGDSMCAMRTCQYMTQVDIEEFLHKDYEEFACSVPTCQARFSQLIDSETHYNAKHRHACSQCKKCLPSAHLLDLHLSETHDSYFQLLSAKKPSFQCFLETCLDRFWSPKDRREHCIQIHSFPKNFKFDATSRKSSSTSRHSKASSSSPQEVRKRQPREPSKKQKARPASVFVAPMETDQIDGNLKTLSSTPPTNSRLPRRLSLNSSSNKSPDKESPMKDTTPEVSLSSSREPFSLAKMGQRLTAKSTFDIQTNLNHESPKSNGSIRRHSGIPTFRGFKKTNSTSSTATTMSSPDRSLTASPTKSRSTVSMNNNSGSSLEASSSSSSRVVNDDLNGNNSPTKSRIPIRSPSCKKAHVPRNVCFGKSSQKAFIKPWYHNFGKSSSENNSMDAFASVDEMKMALDE